MDREMIEETKGGKRKECYMPETLIFTSFSTMHRTLVDNKLTSVSITPR